MLLKGSKYLPLSILLEHIHIQLNKLTCNQCRSVIVCIPWVIGMESIAINGPIHCLIEAQRLLSGGLIFTFSLNDSRSLHTRFWESNSGPTLKWAVKNHNVTWNYLIIGKIQGSNRMDLKYQQLFCTYHFKTYTMYGESVIINVIIDRREAW